MTLAESTATRKCGRRSIRDVRAAGRNAVAKLAQAERLRAEAVAELVEFDAINGHIADGYLTPQRQLIHGSGVAQQEANRLYRLVRFCADHPLLVEQLADGLITIEHADALMKLAGHVDGGEFVDALPDLLRAAVGVELSVFCDRIRSWRWRIQPDVTDEDLDTLYENRSLTMQPGLFGGMKGQFQLDAAGAAVVADALHTRPDPVDTIEGPRTLRQRRADRLVELAAMASLVDDDAITEPDDLAVADPDPDSDVSSGPEGARQQARPTVDVIVDLPTLLGADFDLDDHRTDEGDVDWDSIEASFALTGSAPRRVLQQFFCDASWRTLITAGGSVVLDYTHARPEINRSQRRAVQRRDRHCQFAGCDRHWGESRAKRATLSNPQGCRWSRRASLGCEGRRWVGSVRQPRLVVSTTPHHDPPARLATVARHRRTITHHHPLRRGWCEVREATETDQWPEQVSLGPPPRLRTARLPVPQHLLTA